MKRSMWAVALVGLVLGASPWSGAAVAAEANSPNLFAVVDQTGTLIGGNGVSSSTRLGVGRYEVTFITDVSTCAYVATTENAYSQAITVFTAGGHLSTQGVYVETKNQGGGLTDGPFDLVVDCGTFGMKYAVVGYSADLIRATPGTTLAFLGAGRYNVRFPTIVAPCAFLATVGDPGNALVYNPAGVYTASGSDSRTVYIETKNPGGGLQDGVPFHLAVLCPTAPRVISAVVKPNGYMSRGSPRTASFRSATGNYTVVASYDVSACATIGTRGSWNKDVPFNPTTVELTPRAASNTVGIQVRELLFFGGDLFDESFHTAIVC